MNSRKILTLSLFAAAAAVLVSTVTPPVWAQGTSAGPSPKLKKHIEVMETIFDKVLVGSPNLLVGSSKVTRGLYLQEFGVLFTFETAILSRDRGDWWDKLDWSKFKVETKDGQTIIQLPSDEDEDSSSAKNEKGEKTEKKKPRSTEERYDAGKAELIGALLDYGETLAGLRDDQWVGVAAFFDDDEPIRGREVSTLLIKAKVGDLRAHGAERLSRKDMESRLVIEEN